MTTTHTRLLLTVPEACRELRIGRWMFYQLVRSGELRTVSIGRRRLVSPAALQAFIEKQTNARGSE